MAGLRWILLISLAAYCRPDYKDCSEWSNSMCESDGDPCSEVCLLAEPDCPECLPPPQETCDPGQSCTAPTDQCTATCTAPDPTCADCGPGFYNDGATCSACTKCDDFKTTTTETATDESQCVCVAGRKGDDCSTICSDKKYGDEAGDNCEKNCPADKDTTTDGTGCLCPAGQFDEDGSGNCDPCPEGKYRNSASTDDTACDSCITGYSTDGTGKTDSTDCNVCDKGYKSTDTEPTLVCVACGENQYKDQIGIGGCKECTGNTGHQMTGQKDESACVCRPGRASSAGCPMCGDNQINPDYGGTCQPCPTNKEPNIEKTECVCPAGFYLDGDDCEQCPKGEYSTDEDSTGCELCSDAFTTMDNDTPKTSASDCNVCKVGFAGTGDVCNQCDKGSYADTEGLSSCLPCTGGTTTEFKESKSPNDCVCGPGKGGVDCGMCPERTTSGYSDECSSCGNNFISSEDRTECICPEGHRKSGSNCFTCGRGYYNGEEDSTCSYCGSGETTATATAIGVEECVCAEGFAGSHGSCARCGSETYSDVINLPECKPCEVGYGTDPDDNLHYYCQVCAPGYHTDTGYWQVRLGIDTCIPCPVGSYSIGGDRDQDTGGVCVDWYGSDFCTFAACRPCPNNLLTEHDASTRDDCGCLAGTELGADGYCHDCTNNAYNSEFNGICKECPEGSIATDDYTKCECPPGKEPGVNGTCVECDVDFYKQEWGNDTCQLCPNGTTTRGQTGSDKCDCILCPPGKQPDGYRGCVPCPVDTYNDGNDTTPCEACGDGMSTRGAEGATSCDQECLKGHEANSSGGCSPCRADKFNPKDGLEQCIDCPGGTSTFGEEGAIECNFVDDCEAGLESDGNGTCVECQVNYYKSNPGTFQCIPCPNATDTRNRTGAAECVGECAEGFEPTPGGGCRPCPVNTYKPGPGFYYCEQCPSGSHTNGVTGRTDCEYEVCAAGYERNSDGECVKCRVNYKKSETGAGQCTPCEEGYDTAGLDGQEICVPECGAGQEPNGAGGCRNCIVNMRKPTAGFYNCTPCPATTDTHNQEGQAECVGECVEGFRPTGDGRCEPCPVDHFKAEPGFADCEPCDPGTHTNGQKGRAVCEFTVCNAGYEHDGAGGCKPCDVDFFKTQSGTEQCVRCDPGYDTAGETGSTQCVAECGPGEQPDGNRGCEPCPVDTSKATAGFFECSPCPATTDTHNREGQSECVAECGCGMEPNPDGSGTCVPCDSGYYKSSAGFGSCSQCPIGTDTRDLPGRCACTQICIDDCTDVENGDYQSCLGCNRYVTCTNGNINDNKRCNDGLVWDDKIKKCAESSTTCNPQECPAGYELDNEGGCKECDSGYYKAGIGGEACTKCPENTDTDGNTGSTECMCSAGYQGDGVTCTICVLAYRRGGIPGHVTCTPCPPDTVAPDGATELAQCTAPEIVGELEGTVTLDGNCSAELLDKESEEYKSLAHQLTLEMNALYRVYLLYVSVVDIEFLCGSIVANYRLVFSDDENLPDTSELTDVFNTYISANGGLLAGYPVMLETVTHKEPGEKSRDWIYIAAAAAAMVVGIMLCCCVGVCLRRRRRPLFMDPEPLPLPLPPPRPVGWRVYPSGFTPVLRNGSNYLNYPYFK